MIYAWEDNEEEWTEKQKKKEQTKIRKIIFDAVEGLTENERKL